LRAARFTFLRSSLSSILVVSATCNLFRCNLFSIPGNRVDVTPMLTGIQQLGKAPPTLLERV
jgi:hypothetical protein